MTYLAICKNLCELANEKELTGAPFIFDSNETYVTQKSIALQELQPNFTQSAEVIGGKPVEDTVAYNAAAGAATRYMNRAILAFEESFDGTPNNLDRLNFMDKLNAQIKKNVYTYARCRGYTNICNS